MVDTGLTRTPNQGIEPCAASFGDSPASQSLRHIAVEGVAPSSQAYETRDLLFVLTAMITTLYNSVELVRIELTTCCLQGNCSPY